MNRKIRYDRLGISLIITWVALGLGMLLFRARLPAVARGNVAPTTPREVVIALGQEPASLYVYGDSSLAAQTVRNALMDGPFTSVDFAHQATILTKLPDLQDGDVAFHPVTVMTGSRVIADDGQVVTLNADTMFLGVRLWPSGCRSSRCAVLFDGSPLQMDQMVVTFTLRSNVRWSDGAPLTARDALFGQQIACDPDTPEAKQLCEYTAAYSAANDMRTVVWTSLPGYWSQTANLNFWTPLPYHILGGQTAAQILAGDYGRTPLGWGPFRMVEWVQGSHITLERNPYYWRTGYPKLDRATFRFMSDAAEIYAAMQRGEIHLASQTTSVANDYINDLLNPNPASAVHLLWTSSSVWEHTDFGILPADGRYAFFADRQLRRAVAYAIDRQRIIDEVWYGLDTVPDAYIPAAHPLYAPALMTYPYSSTLAAALLSQAGWIDTNANGIRDKDGREFVITYSTTTAPARIRAGQIISENLAAVGIRVNLDFQPAGTFFADGPEGPVFGRKFDLANFAWGASIEPSCELYLSSRIPSEENGWAGSNDPGYNNPDYDAACEQALAAWPGTLEYVQGHRAAMQILSEDLPMLPIFRRLKLAAASTAFSTGPRLDAHEFAETWNIWEWDLNLPSSCYVRVSSLPGVTYFDLQMAIDAAQSGDTLKVAGTCTGVQARPRRDLMVTGVVTQVAYIGKSLTLQGGYTTTNWLHPNPTANPTTLDALGQGRVLYVTGNINVNVEGLHITGGNATGLGGMALGQDAGGGVYVITATVNFYNNRVVGNVAAGSGGGFYVHRSNSTLWLNTIASNQSGLGGGVAVYAGQTTLRRNSIMGNTVTDSGGGVYLYYSSATVEYNRILANTATNYGGGLSLCGGAPVLFSNVVRFNQAMNGGGLDLNRVGGGYTNNVIVDNQATDGGGLYARGATAHLLHTTLARNGGNGIYVTNVSGASSSLVMTNTIMAGHGVGINVAGGNALTADTLLWHDTPITIIQAPAATVVVRNDWIADPRFDADGYHLRIGSAALDAGLPSALPRDVDGDPRPYGAGFDVGADEVPYVQALLGIGAKLEYSGTTGNTMTLNVPPTAVTRTLTIVLTQLDPETLETPPQLASGGIALQLDAYLGDERLENFIFEKPVTLTLTYSDTDVAGIDESTLRLYRQVCVGPEGCTWEMVGVRPGEGQTLDAENNVLTAWLRGFTRFRGMGAVAQPAWQLSKAYSSTWVAGTPVTYTLTLTNVGMGDATAVVLEDVVPKYLSWTSGGTLSLDRVRWTFEAITASGGTAVGEFSAILPCTASLNIVNDNYRVVSSAQEITSTVGPPVSFMVISPTLTVGITYTPLAPVAGDTVYFTATATTNGTPLSYAWSFGGTGLHTAHPYPQAGTYAVTFTATDGCGYQRMATATVNVKAAGHKIYLPLVMRQN